MLYFTYKLWLLIWCFLLFKLTLFYLWNVKSQTCKRTHFVLKFHIDLLIFFPAHSFSLFVAHWTLYVLQTIQYNCSMQWKFLKMCMCSIINSNHEYFLSLQIIWVIDCLTLVLSKFKFVTEFLQLINELIIRWLNFQLYENEIFRHTKKGTKLI